MSEQTQIPKDLSAEEWEQIVTDFIARDGPGPGDLPTDTFFALWERFEAERRAQVIELEQDIIDGEIVLSVAPTSPTLVQVERNEIRLEDGRRIVLRLRRPRQKAISTTPQTRYRTYPQHAGAGADGEGERRREDELRQRKIDTFAKPSP